MHDPTQDDELEETEKINVVPLADLTLVLLIVLMVLSPMVSQSMLRVQAPDVGERNAAASSETPGIPEESPDPLLVELTETGQQLNNVKYADLRVLLQVVEEQINQKHVKEEKRAPVIVVASNTVRMDRIVRVLDGVKLAGAVKVALAKNAQEEARR